MAEKSYTFPALRVSQGDGAPALVMLSASAVKIATFAGIPQKRRVEEGETVGFQRDENEERVSNLAEFFSNPGNVIANPLLCAIRQDEGVEVVFAAAPTVEGETGHGPNAGVTGQLTIRCPDLEDRTLLELFRLAREAVEKRVPELAQRDVPQVLVQKLSTSIVDQMVDEVDDETEIDEDEEGEPSPPDGDAAGAEDGSGSGVEEALFEESHVTEFWDALRAREILLTKLVDRDRYSSFLGFGRDALEAYLRPVVLVDGQHRLLGAMKAAKQREAGLPRDLEALTEAIRSGTDVSSIQEERLDQLARRLPISLLMDSRAQEHVFQFVIVNQKATPVRPALLETIISSSLSEAEVAPIAERLEKAGVPLKTARAMTSLVRSEHSPFYNKVARGMADEGAELLPWSVFGQLVSLFRNLKGARFFHDRKSDYAGIWRKRFLDQSDIVKDTVRGDLPAFDAWSSADGPWRDVFIEFWIAVRDTLGTTTNPDAPNYWGRPRSSNLFNKPSLLTLATDFFAFLVETRRPLPSSAAVPEAVADWLEGTNPNYFARDWKLRDVKKDAVGTRKQWSSLWQRYRIDPTSLPNVRSYSLSYQER